MIPFPEDKLHKLLNQIDQTLETLDRPAIAAFDADGTLWNMDMSENFVQYQEKHNLLPELPNSPWQEHLKKHKEDPKSAYLWLAQVNANHPIETVRAWAQNFINDYGTIPTFDCQKTIIDHLRSKQVEIFVITASVKWAVEPGAKLYGIEPDHVLGVSTKIADGIVTTEQDGPITWREGKVAGLLEATNGIYPFFAAGNSNGDLPLIESATDLHLVMAAAQPGEHTFQTEQEMLALAKERGWYSHRFFTTS